MDGELFVASETEGLGTLSSMELQGQDSHTDEVGSVNSLETLGDHGFYSLKEGTLGGPISRGT